MAKLYPHGIKQENHQVCRQLGYRTHVTIALNLGQSLNLTKFMRKEQKMKEMTTIP